MIVNLNPFNQKITEGISLFTAVKNRKETLEESLKTWVCQDQIDEIVILDWTSDESLIPLVQQYQNGKIILAVVRNQPRWILSHAYNLAARLTSKSKILKIDSDVKILPGFFEQHTLEPGIFFTGNWKIARNPNEKHLHGMSFMFRNSFFSVNGYNEFIKSYGWDDIDLYARLENKSLTRKNFKHDTLLHIPHENRTSFQNQVNYINHINDTEKSLLNSLINRFLSSTYKPWTTAEKQLEFSVEVTGDHIISCRQEHEDQNIVPVEIILQCESQAIVERFYELGAGLSKELLSELNREELIALLNLFYTRKNSPDHANLFNLIQKSHKKFDLLAESKHLQPIPDHPTHGPGEKRDYPRKVNLGNQVGAWYGSHRSGWGFAFSALADLHNPDGILLDAFIERTFHWHPEGIRPHLQPWIGFIHVPPIVPKWFAHEVSNDAIFSLPQWQESFKYCKGLFTLSQYHQRMLQARLNIPVNNLLHPTEVPQLKWEWSKFEQNGEKKVVQVGFWLRKLYAIHLLKADHYQKVFLRKKDANIDFLLEEERKYSEFRDQITEEAVNSVKSIEFLSNQEYDRLLTENIVFLDLYDASANNSIIECIVRNTPVLVNPLEPVVEYLGPEYPFYFNDLAEASIKLDDMALIMKTHLYLKELPVKKKLTPEYFIQSLVESPIYKSL
ncbi:MAG: galactosyltransferase-related protein [Bacteroidetes bacterium]|nr:galactosyltransferase-related protein [Bacteroidota bacterium]